MSSFTKSFKQLFALIVALILGCQLATAANEISLYTPYTKISVPPGQSIDYSVDVINKGDQVQNVPISVTGIPHSWKYEMKSGGWSIAQLSVLPGEKRSFNLKIEVPLNVNKGNYRIKIQAGEFDALPITINVSEQGTFNTEFTIDQPNMEGPAKSTFTYKARLKNGTSDQQLFAFNADAPRGWSVAFKVDMKQVSSVTLEANQTKDVIVEVVPPETVEAGKYEIPVSAATNNNSSDMHLEAVVTGSFGMELTTPTGLMSTDITAGDQKRIALVVKNTGSTDLTDIKMSFSAPANWDITFDPKRIDRLKTGSTAEVYATIKAYKKSIAGDYVATIEAKTPEVSSKASFRISVETPMLWGIVGVIIIVVAIGCVYYLFRKYGRR
ncbi:MAG TPA: NEW3 domain-containing protein [Prolixibacteraceae bacterium]|mgnify:CR=1 FL=1|nr:NEW3 domain-containing protein [Prolixibacteraceae bacterium]HPS12286.1 NEW3 domain-containing protein [Prolixibacteraceae bacterium]